MLIIKSISLYICVRSKRHLPAIYGISINMADTRYTHSNNSRLICIWNGICRCFSTFSCSLLRSCCLWIQTKSKNYIFVCDSTAQNVIFMLTVINLYQSWLCTSDKSFDNIIRNELNYNFISWSVLLVFSS